MTSGEFHSVLINEITCERETRQRADLDDVNILADSIHRLGLIHPIVLTRDNVLVSGERRLSACISLGWTHISSQYVDEVPVATLRAIELEENVKRRDLPWQDECLAVHEYFQIRKKEVPDFNLFACGTELGMEHSTVSVKINLAEELIARNPRIIEAPKLSTARGIMERAEARRDDESILQIRKMLQVKPEEEEPDAVINRDFLSWAPTYDGPKFNFVHCDFPFGIGADSFNQGSAPTHGGYADTEETYWNLCKCLTGNLRRLTTDSCHFMLWFSMHFYTQTLNFFNANSDISLDPFPLVWIKSDNVGILPDPQRGPRRIYETAFFGSRGDRRVVAPISNAYSAPTDRSQHMSIKPEPVLRNFFRMFVDQSTFMLDPTCGSGSALRAAESLNAALVLGLEVNPDFAKGASLAMRKFRTLRKVVA